MARMARSKRHRRPDWRKILLFTISLTVALMMVLAYILPNLPTGPS